MRWNTRLSTRVIAVTRIVAVGASLTLFSVILLRSDETLDTLRALDAWALLWIVALQAVYLLPQAYRYWIILDSASDGAVRFWPWARVFVVGRFLNLAIAQAGNVYRAVTLKRQHGITYTEYITAFFAFTWLATVLNLALAILVVVVSPPSFSIGQIPVLLVLAFAFVVVALTPIVLSRLLRAGATQTTFWGKLQSRSTALLRSSVGMLRLPALMIRFVTVGIVGFGLAVAIFGLTFRSLQIEVSMAETVLFYVLLQLTTYLVITPGNLGIQELSFGGLAEATGIGLTPGLVAGAVIRVTGVVALIITGFALGGVGALKEARSASVEASSPD